MNLIKFTGIEAAQVGVKTQIIGYDSVGTLMATDYLREGYTEGGRLNMFSNDLITYIANYNVGILHTLDYIKEEKPGAGIIIGAHWWGSMVAMIESLYLEDGFSVAGTVYPADTAGAALAADVVTFGEENVAMGSYVSGDELSLSCLVGEDLVKFGLMLCCIILPILIAAGVHIQ
jgi:hypothetical protein